MIRIVGAALAAALSFAAHVGAETVHLYDGGSAHVYRSGAACVIAYGEGPFDAEALFVDQGSAVVFAAPAKRIGVAGWPVRLRFHEVRDRGAFEVEAETVEWGDGSLWYEAPVTGRLFMLVSDTVVADGGLTVAAIQRGTETPIEVIEFGAILGSAAQARVFFDRCRERP